MNAIHANRLQPRTAHDGQVNQIGQSGWRLEIPAGSDERYRLAQLDDYAHSPRRGYPWQPPFHLSLRARASAASIPGTWGFGLWNDPFRMDALSGTILPSLPTFPDAAWFFFAAPPNHLSLQDDQPAQGWLAMSWRAPPHPAAWLAASLPLTPLLLLPPSARWLRRLGTRLVHQASAALTVDPTDWHTYELEWQVGKASFWVDGAIVLETDLAPASRLGLVLWIDNQYAAWGADGRLRWGLLANPAAAWIEVAEIERGTVRQ
jgi:hypothetical protein